VRNTVLVLAARVVSRLIALVTVIAMANSLGDTGFGRLQTLVTLTNLVSVVADLGFFTLFVREGARHPDQVGRYLDNVLSVKALLLIVAFGVLAGTLHIVGLSDLLLPGFALLALAGYSNVLRGTFYAIQKLTYEAVDIVLESLVLVGITALGVATHQGIAFFLWGYAASYGFSCVYFIAVLALRGIAKPRWRLELDLLRPWFVAALPLAVTYVLATVYFKVDVPILQHFRPYAEVGWYTLAYKPFEALLFVPLTMRTVIFPVMSVFYRAAPDRLQVSAEKFFKALTVTGLPCGIALAVLTPGINALLRLYPESEPALRILAVGIVFMFLDNTFIAVFNAMDRQVAYMWIAAGGLVFNVVLNLILIPSYGYLGASWATTVTEMALVAAGWGVLARLARPLPIWHAVWRVLGAGALMTLVLLPLRDLHGAAVVGALGAGAATYVIGLLVLGAFDAEERALVGRALRRGGAVAPPPPPPATSSRGRP
jgi:O-antigen/teichoic acid export membrane protein